MSRRLRTVLLFATATTLLALPANAGVRSGASFHPAVGSSIHPIARPPALPRNHSHFAAGTHHKFLRNIHKFSHRHHHDQESFGWGFPYGFGDAPYDPYFTAAEEPGDTTPYQLRPGSLREGRFYRTGCRSEEVSVPSSHGPTYVTVTRCSVPILESPPLK